MRLDYGTGVDREIAPSERRRRVGVRVMVTAVPIVAVVLLLSWLPDLMRYMRESSVGPHNHISSK